MGNVEIKKTQMCAKNNKKSNKNKKKTKINHEYENYFSFYDDLKHGDTKHVDW